MRATPQRSTSGPGSARPLALVLRALGLGDYLAGVPAYRALRRALPGHQLVLAAPGALAPLVDLTDALDRHVAAGELQPIPWTWPAPDVAIDLHGNGPESRRLLEALGPRRLVGFASARLRDPGAPRWRDREHERARWCRLVREEFGVAADPDDVLLRPPAEPSARPGCVVVHPGAAFGARRWPPERFAAVARALAHDRDVVVTGSADELQLAADVAWRAGLPPASVVAGGTDLGNLAGLVAGAALVVSGDTGVAHLASAYGTPSVTLFGPTPPELWGPPRRDAHVTLWHGTGRGDPWSDVPHPALLAIEADEVLAAAHRLLAAAGRSRSAMQMAGR